MIRGRRVFFVWILFLLSFFMFVPAALAASLNVTATVPLSSVWQKSIEDHSVTSLDISSHQNIAFSTARVQGMENIPMRQEHIQALFYKDNKLTQRQEKTTDTQGNVDFTFVYTKGDVYRIIYVDVEHEFPFVIGTIRFNG